MENQEINNILSNVILLDKAVKWLENNVYAGFDSMCLSFDSKEKCIAKFIKDMKDPNYGVTKTWYDDDDW